MDERVVQEAAHRILCHEDLLKDLEISAPGD
jgi:hypothetical protein